MKCYVGAFFALFCVKAVAQQNGIQRDIYYLKHTAADSFTIQDKNAGSKINLKVTNFINEVTSDTLCISISNRGEKDVLGTKVCVFKGVTGKIESTRMIDYLSREQTILLKIPVSKDSLFTIVYSDFSNNTNKLIYSPKRILSELRFFGFEIDDSTPVGRLMEKPYRVDGKLDFGETGRFLFKINNIEAYPVGQLKAQLVSSYGDIAVKSIKNNFTQSDSAVNSGVLIFDVSSSLYYDNVPLALKIFMADKLVFEKNITVLIGKRYYFSENISNTNKEINTEVKVTSNALKNNIIISVGFPELSWDEKMIGTFSVKGITDTTFAFKSNKEISRNGDEFSFGLPADGLYRTTVTFQKRSSLSYQSYLLLKYTPSLMNGDFQLGNQKMGIRYMRLKRFGYYIEGNTSLSRVKSDYDYNSETRTWSNFDSYNNYYVPTNKLKVVTRDVGAGLAYRLNKTLSITAGLSYYDYKIKQEITEYRYSDTNQGANTDVLLAAESFSKLMGRYSINYERNNLIYGLELANYSLKSRSFRIGFQLGVKF
jgi:hypothetical protein